MVSDHVEFHRAMEVVHLSSVKYSVGGLSFMDGRGFVGISVLKKGRKWRMNRIMEKMQTLSFACRLHVWKGEASASSLLPLILKTLGMILNRCY